MGKLILGILILFVLGTCFGSKSSKSSSSSTTTYKSDPHPLMCKKHPDYLSGNACPLCK